MEIKKEDYEDFYRKLSKFEKHHTRFSDLFDTSKMDKESLIKFLYDSETYYSIWDFILKMELPFSLSAHYDIIYSLIDESNDEYLKVWRKFVKNYIVFHLAARCGDGIEWVFGSDKETMYAKNYNYIIKELKNNNNNNLYYRGQSNYGWNLTASLMRGLPYKYDYIDKQTLYTIYNDAGIIEKYNKTFADQPLRSGDDLDYVFLSRMQHFVSYSPLVDFTKEPYVALSFALDKSVGFNNWLNNDACIYVMEIKKEKNNNNNTIEDFNIINYKNKIVPGTKVNIKGHIVDFSSLKNIEDALTPDFIMFSTDTSDRMKYQRGTLVFFYNYLAVGNNEILYELNKNIRILKLKIPKGSKETIYNEVKTRDEFNTPLLMNPYDYFNKW